MGARPWPQSLELIASTKGSMHKLPRKRDMLWLIVPGETVHRLPEMRTRLVCCPRWQNAVSRWNSWCRELVGSSRSTLRKCTWSLQGCQTQQRDHPVWQPESEQRWGSQSIWLLSSTSHLTSSWVFGTNWRIHYSHHLDVVKGPVICKGIKKMIRKKRNEPMQGYKYLIPRPNYV